MKAQNYVKGDFGLATRKPLTSSHGLWILAAFAVPVALGAWGTTQWFASVFAYAPALGPTLDGAHTYAPWQIFTWLSAMQGDALPELAKARGFLMLSVAAGMVTALFAFSSIMRDLKNRADEAHDSGRWGREDELREHGLLVKGYPKDGIVLGTYQPDPNRPARQGDAVQRVVDNTDTPVAVVGPPGAGKNVVIGFPTLLAWRHSAFVIDPKLESFINTAGYRSQKLNQWTGILDFAATEREVYSKGERVIVDTLHYNHLGFIRLGTDFEVRDAGSTALYFTDSSGKGAEDARTEHWVVTPAGLLAAACLHVMYRARREGWGREATLFDVAWELSGRDHPAVEAAIRRAVQLLVETKKPVPEDTSKLVDPTAEVIRSWLTYEHAATDADAWERPNGTKTRTHLFVAMRAQEQLDRMSTPEGSGHLSTVRKVLTLFEDPQTRRVTSRSDFRVEDLQALRVNSPDGEKDGITLYVPFSLADTRTKPLYRALICQATSRLTETQKPKHERKRLLYFLDEFPTLGRLDVLFNIFGVGRGFGIKPVVLFQTFAQVEEKWGVAAARALIDTVETLVAMAPGPGAVETAERLSKMTGRVTVRADNRSRSAQGGRTNVSDSQRESSRPLLTAVEISALPRTLHKQRDGKDVTRGDGSVVMKALGHQLMFRKNLPVVRLLQAPHYADPIYLRLTRIEPPNLRPFQAGRVAARIQPSAVRSLSPAPGAAASSHAASSASQCWARPDIAILGEPSAAPPDEDATALMEVLEAALQAHDLENVSLGQPLIGPRLVIIELTGSDDARSALEQVLPELAAALSRPVALRLAPTPHLAVPRLTPHRVSPADLPPPDGVQISLGLNTDGAPVSVDLATCVLRVTHAAAPALVRWLAPLAAGATPLDLQIEVLCSTALAMPWPHVRRRTTSDLLDELDLTPAQPRRIVVADDTTDAHSLERLRALPSCGIILLSSESALEQQGDATVICDDSLPSGDIWFASPKAARTLVHTPFVSDQQLSALEAHWRGQCVSAAPALVSDDGNYDEAALFSDLCQDIDSGADV